MWDFPLSMVTSTRRQCEAREQSKASEVLRGSVRVWKSRKASSQISATSISYQLKPLNDQIQTTPTPNSKTLFPHNRYGIENPRRSSSQRQVRQTTSPEFVPSHTPPTSTTLLLTFRRRARRRRLQRPRPHRSRRPRRRQSRLGLVHQQRRHRQQRDQRPR